MTESTDIPRKLVDELILSYEVEPTLCDIFVEGTTDKSLLEWYIRSSGSQFQDLAIYAIDEINITDEMLHTVSLSRGNKNEVIALCSEIFKTMGATFNKSVGIIDRDADDILDATSYCNLVIKTHYSCIEMHFASNESLGKILNLAFGIPPTNIKSTIDSISPVLKELFLIRSASHVLELNAKWQIPDSFIASTKGTITFRRDDFLRHFLQKNRVLGKLKDVERTIESLRNRLQNDIRHTSNGHDFVLVLSKLLKSITKAKYASKCDIHVIAALLSCSLDLKEFCADPTFSTLLERIGTTEPGRA